MLLPAFARHTEGDDPAIVRVLTEHVEPSASAGPGGQRGSRSSRAAELGGRLESHIRFEEWVLFQLIEEALPVDELERLSAAFARAEADHE